MQNLQSLLPWASSHITLTSLLVITIGLIFFFFLKDVQNYVRGRRDPVQEDELPLGDQLIRGVAREFHVTPPPLSSTETRFSLSSHTLAEELKKTTLDPAIQTRILTSAEAQADVEPYTARERTRGLRYHPILQYWITGILLFGLSSGVVLTLTSHQSLSSFKPISVFILLICGYLLFVARHATSQLLFEEGHVLMGEDTQHLLREQDYDTMYYMNARSRVFGSFQKQYLLVVFRKGNPIVPLAYFLDTFFPASNANRQVIFFHFWKDASGETIADASLMQALLERCDRQGVKVKYWPFEAQLVLIALLFFIGLFSFILAK